MIPRFISQALLAVLLFVPLGALHAQTTEVGGVKFDNTATIANTKVVLNGAGVRYKAIFKVYAAGLYTTAKSGTPEAVLATPGPKRMHIVMLRDINASELGKLFTRGMEDNAPREEFSKSIPGTLTMSDLFFAKKKLNAGDSFYLDWIPGVGTNIVINGKASAEPIKEPEFYSALLKLWLGKNPADTSLKESLLGRPPVTNANANTN